MLSVLADVGGIFAGILQIAWKKNKNRIKMIAKKLQLEKHRSVWAAYSSSDDKVEISLTCLLSSCSSERDAKQEFIESQ